MSDNRATPIDAQEQHRREQREAEARRNENAFLEGNPFAAQAWDLLGAIDLKAVDRYSDEAAVSRAEAGICAQLATAFELNRTRSTRP